MRRKRLTQIMWFAGLWFAGVAALGIVAFMIRLMI